MSTAASSWAAPDDDDVINIGKGHPNPRFLPLQEIREAFATASVAENAAVKMLQYGRMQGNPELCDAIATLVTKASERTHRPCCPENILITTGSGPALSLITQLYSRPGQTVFVDSPAYFLAFPAFKDAGLEVVEIPTTEAGIDLDALEAQAQLHPPALVYTVPVGNNPTGVSMTNAHRERLVDLSKRFRFRILADEVYLLLTFPTCDNSEPRAPRSLMEFDDPDDPTVFAIHSFSKLLGPGLRLGWVETHHTHIERMVASGSIQSGGGMNPFTSEVVLRLLDNGVLARQISTLRDAYALNCDVLCRALDEFIPPALQESSPDDTKWSHTRPTGGFFVFMKLPSHFDTARLRAQAKSQFGVEFFNGAPFSKDGTGFTNCVRLCFAFLEPPHIREGIRRLSRAVAAYRSLE